MNDSTPSPPTRRVALTGVGLVTPLGTTRESTWNGILDARRCVDWISAESLGFPASAFRSPPFGAAVQWDGPCSDRLVTFARAAAREAADHARLHRDDLRHAACVIGTSKINLAEYDQWVLNPSECRESCAVLFPSHAASQVAADLGCEVGAVAPVAACATGLVALIQAASLIQSGKCPIAIAGGADASLHPGLLSSYRRLGVLAQPLDDPGRACRPFDADRTGFAVGEGAGALVLEDWDRAKERDAPILAEWIDGIIGSDPDGMTRIESHGAGLAALIRKLLERNSLSCHDIDVVSLHATATELNDLAEGAAMDAIFRDRAHPVPAFGIKGAIGHLMGAAGAVETAIGVLSLRHQKLPTTVNHEKWGDIPSKGFLITRQHQQLQSPLRILLKVSMGFGGTIAAALLRYAEQ